MCTFALGMSSRNAVREAQLKAWTASEESNDWLKGAEEDGSKAV